LFTSAGHVVAADTLTPVEGFDGIPVSIFNRLCVDGAMGRVYFLANSAILVYDIASRTKLGSLQLPLMAAPRKFLKYSGYGLAIVTASGELYLLRISSIPLAFVPPTITSVGTAYGSSNIAQNTWI